MFEPDLILCWENTERSGSTNNTWASLDFSSVTLISLFPNVDSSYAGLFRLDTRASRIGSYGLTFFSMVD